MAMRVLVAAAAAAAVVVVVVSTCSSSSSNSVIVVVVVVVVVMVHLYTTHLTQIHFSRLKFMTFILCDVLRKVKKKGKAIPVTGSGDP
jgi:hypothetical protein